jgi:hypothetical protein
MICGSSRGFPALCALTLGVLTAANSCYAEGTAQKSAQIEYIAPDGQFSSLTANPATDKPSASFIDRDTISCTLREGETTFIIQLPKGSLPDRFTFIAVSDSALPAASPKWTEVDGIVPFAHKRLFKLSMLGVETKFVRLSFKVEGEPQNSARISDPFRTSLLAAEICSSFTERSQHDLDLRFVTSVGALWAKQN